MFAGYWGYSTWWSFTIKTVLHCIHELRNGMNECHLMKKRSSVKVHLCGMALSVQLLYIQVFITHPWRATERGKESMSIRVVEAVTSRKLLSAKCKKTPDMCFILPQNVRCADFLMERALNILNDRSHKRW